MGYFAYHRVSSKGQKLDRGLSEIDRFCKERGIMLKNPVFTDKQSGKTFDRPRYIVLKEDVLRKDDVLIITEVDRLGRNKQQIVKELNDFKAMGVRVMILELPTTLMEIDTTNTLNKLILETIQNMVIELYACLAESELEKKNKRQLEGIAEMKARGDWDQYGRPAACEWSDFIEAYKRVLSKDLKACEAMRILKISVATYYRYRQRFEVEIIGKAV